MLIKNICKYFLKKNKEVVIKETKIMDEISLRSKFANNGWNLNEIPIKGKDSNGQMAIIRWKLIAVKNGKSFEVVKDSLLSGMIELAQMLGLIPRNAK